ncbi:MAG: glutamate racemase [Clostridia bacterium]|nr:glutamate racemase [Clostridia bacterium]
MNLQKNAPIGVFDSGLGGISVLRELQALMPAEDFLYFGDDQNAPYGVRPEDEVLSLTRAGAERLFGAGCKAVVLACNTATAAAVVPLRALWSDRILVGAEPAIKPAIRDGHRKIGVLATSTTLSSRRFCDLARTLGGEAKIFPIPAPGLVELIEARIWSGAELENFLHGLLDGPISNGVDALVLGCTHYPFVRDAIDAVSGGLPLYDGNAGIARQTRRLLAEAGSLRDAKQGSVTLLECGQSADFFRLARELISTE